MELMPKASVRRDFLLHSLAITAILGVRLDSGWWNRSPDGWVQAGWVPFKSASFPLPAGTLAPEGSSARAGGDNVGFQLMRRCWLWWADRRQRTRLQPMCPLCTIAIPIALSPLLHTGDHSPVASSSPHPVVELLCRWVGPVWTLGSTGCGSFRLVICFLILHLEAMNQYYLANCHFLYDQCLIL